MTDRSPRHVTRLLGRAARGEDSAAAELLPVVYDNLRALAGEFFRHERGDHTLQPTALVHEAYVKLTGPAGVKWEDRAHFFAVAARAMRQILADHARSRKRLKRGGENRHRVTLSGVKAARASDPVDLVALEDALVKLGKTDARQCRIVELRFLAGLGVDDVARVLGLSSPTVKREWRMARAWLRRELAEEPAR